MRVGCKKRGPKPSRLWLRQCLYCGCVFRTPFKRGKVCGGCKKRLGYLTRFTEIERKLLKGVRL